jgi:hypothetical protein
VPFRSIEAESIDIAPMAAPFAADSQTMTPAIAETGGEHIVTPAVTADWQAELLSSCAFSGEILQPSSADERTKGCRVAHEAARTAIASHRRFLIGIVQWARLSLLAWRAGLLHS